MLDVRNFLLKNNKNCIFLSDEQSEGRGRRGDIWYSPLGNIYCSISFDNFLKNRNYFLFNVLITTSIKLTLEKFGAENIYFKWPNDIFYKNKKFAGIISENINIDKMHSYIIVGFGINIVSSPEIRDYNSTFIKSFCNMKKINKFLSLFFKILFSKIKDLKKGKKNELINIFCSSLMLIDKKIKIKFTDCSHKIGIFRGIDIDGSLKLEKDNKIENIYNGSIEL